MKNPICRKPEIIFVTPEQLPGLEIGGLRVVILDIPFSLPVAPSDFPLSHPQTQEYYKKVFEEDALTFIRKLGNRLVLWIDHHEHVEWNQFRDDPRFLLVANAGAPACAMLVKPELFKETIQEQVDTILCHGDLDGLISTARFLLHGELPYPEALQDAIAADTRQGNLSSNGRLIDRAIKAVPDNAIRRAALNWLYEQKPQAYQLLQSAEKKFPDSSRTLTQTQEVGSCRILDARYQSTSFDMTQTLRDLQQGNRVGIVIYSKGEEERIWIGGYGNDIYLPKLLDLPGGSPRRVCVDAGHLEEAVTRINRQVGNSDIAIPPPNQATIEITRRCNLRCALCPVGNQTARQMPDMEFDTFKKIIDLFGTALDSITLHNYGEPLLHLDLTRFIQYAKDSGILQVNLTTNGNHLPVSLARSLVTSGLDRIRFSVDTSDPVAYAQYRKGGSLIRVLHNIESLRKTREKLGALLPEIEAQALLMQQNETFIGKFEKTMQASGADSVRYKTFNIFMSGKEWKNQGMEFLPEDSRYSRYAKRDPEPATEDSEIRNCSWPWEHLVVLADGTFVPCCHDFNGDYPLGKITGVNERQAVWDTPERRSFMLRRILRPTSFEMCRRCSSTVADMSRHKLVTPQAAENKKGII